MQLEIISMSSSCSFYWKCTSQLCLLKGLETMTKSVAIITHIAQLMISKQQFPLKVTTVHWLIPGLMQGMYQISLGHFVVSETTSLSKRTWAVWKELRSSREDSPTGPRWNNWNSKNSIDYNRLRNIIHDNIKENTH